MRQGQVIGEGDTDGGRRRQTAPYRPKEDGTARRVVALVARERNIPPQLLLHPSRCRQGVAKARQLAMYLMHVGLGRSLAEVGRFYGRDRSTVSYACAQIEDQRDDPKFDAAVTKLEEQIMNIFGRDDLESLESSHVG